MPAISRWRANRKGHDYIGHNYTAISRRRANIRPQTLSCRLKVVCVRMWSGPVVRFECCSLLDPACFGARLDSADQFAVTSPWWLGRGDQQSLQVDRRSDVGCNGIATIKSAGQTRRGSAEPVWDATASQQSKARVQLPVVRQNLPRALKHTSRTNACAHGRAHVHARGPCTHPAGTGILEHPSVVEVLYIHICRYRSLCSCLSIPMSIHLAMHRPTHMGRPNAPRSYGSFHSSQRPCLRPPR